MSSLPLPSTVIGLLSGLTSVGQSPVRVTSSVSLSVTSDQPHDAPQPKPGVIVTIDGPAGTGKSSTARSLAKRLNLKFLDTGAMYRAAAALVLDAGVDPGDAAAVCRLVADADLHFQWEADPPRIYTMDRATGLPRYLDHRIRQPDVTQIVSPLAGISELRRHMVRKQQLIGVQLPRLVTEGRDQGSVVFPNAQVKFYLNASPMVRAARRADQIREAGGDADERELVREITARDLSDSSRPEGPLIKPRGAIEVDTTDLTFAQVVDTLERHVRAAVPDGQFDDGPQPS
jgi:cytidylate kinase